MAGKFIKNGIVKLEDWEADHFYETHSDGFVGAARVYETPTGSYGVLFKDRSCYFLYDGDTVQDRENIKQSLVAMQKAGKINSTLEALFEEDVDFVVIGKRGVLVNEDALDEYEFSAEQKQDIIAHMDDLENYWEDTSEDAF